MHRQLTDDLEAQQQSLLLSAERLEHSLSDDLRHGHTPERMHFSLSPACRGPGGAGAAAQAQGGAKGGAAPVWDSAGREASLSAGLRVRGRFTFFRPRRYAPRVFARVARTRAGRQA